MKNHMTLVPDNVTKILRGISDNAPEDFRMYLGKHDSEDRYLRQDIRKFLQACAVVNDGDFQVNGEKVLKILNGKNVLMVQEMRGIVPFLLHQGRAKNTIITSKPSYEVYSPDEDTKTNTRYTHPFELLDETSETSGFATSRGPYDLVIYDIELLFVDDKQISLAGDFLRSRFSEKGLEHVFCRIPGFHYDSINEALKASENDFRDDYSMLIRLDDFLSQDGSILYKLSRDFEGHYLTEFKGLRGLEFLTIRKLPSVDGKYDCDPLVGDDQDKCKEEK
jgi:hypothetical protein